MKNIKKRDVLRKAEVAAEYVTTISVAKAIGDNVSEDQLVSELNKYQNATLGLFSTAQESWFEEELLRLKPMSDHVASLVLDGNEAYLTGARVFHTAKSSMSGGVNSKEDFTIRTTEGKEHRISLKQYKSIDNVQVASGTYLSTLIGLAFEPIGRGSFTTPCGTKVSSKTGAGGNWGLLVDKLVQYYGADILEPIEELARQTKEVHKYRYASFKPENWSKGSDSCTKLAGRKAVPYFIQALSIISRANPNQFKSRILNRIGLSNPDGSKELVFVDAKGRSISSFRNPEVSSWVKGVNESGTQMRFEGKDQSAVFYFDSPDGKELLKFTIPLTINSNGAWANNTGFHKKEGIYLEARQRRPKKSMELDTSTNCWLKTPKKLIKK